MSKFFGKKGDTSSSSSESDSEEETKKPQQISKAKKFYDSDDEGEAEQRTIVKKTDKLTAVLHGVFDKMKNHIKINDFTALQNDFEEVQSEIKKSIDNSAFGTDKY